MVDEKRRINQHLAEHPLDEWAKARGVALVYSGGQVVEVGDFVDFGATVGDPTEGPYPGEVVEIRTDRVVVDTHLNSVQAFDPQQLRLLGRAK